jgi:hypothetical protein
VVYIIFILTTIKAYAGDKNLIKYNYGKNKEMKVAEALQIIADINLV